MKNLLFKLFKNGAFIIEVPFVIRGISKQEESLLNLFSTNDVHVDKLYSIQETAIASKTLNKNVSSTFPKIQADDFLRAITSSENESEFRNGEEVEAYHSTTNHWKTYKFVGMNPENHPHKYVLAKHDGSVFKHGKIRKKADITGEVTLEEISEKFGIPLSKLKIVKDYGT